MEYDGDSSLHTSSPLTLYDMVLRFVRGSRSSIGISSSFEGQSSSTTISAERNGVHVEVVNPGLTLAVFSGGIVQSDPETGSGERRA